MGCIASAIASCCCSCCGVSCANCCKSMCNKSTQTRLPYLIVMAISVVLSLIGRYTTGWVLKLYWFSFDVCTSNECYGQAAVYRISSAMCCFYAIHALCMLSPKTRSLHYNLWCLKIILLAVLIIVFFLIPNAPFDVYGIIARIVSAFFLLLQIIILIEFAYTQNKTMLHDDRIADGGNKWFIINAACSFIMYAASVVICVFCFIWFTNSTGCGQNKALIIVTILLTAFVTILSITNWATKGNILTSSVVTLYCFYLCYTALSSDPSSCNDLSQQSTAQVVAGIAIAAIAVTYAGWNLSNSSTIFGEDEADRAAPEVDAKDESKAMASAAGAAGSGDIEKGASSADKADKAANEPSEASEKLEAYRRNRDLKFHLVMAACSMYMAMIITSWGTAQTSNINSSNTAYDLSHVALWIKIGSQWATILLYTWTLVAPQIWPERFEE